MASVEKKLIQSEHGEVKCACKKVNYQNISPERESHLCSATEEERKKSSQLLYEVVGQVKKKEVQRVLHNNNALFKGGSKKA